MALVKDVIRLFVRWWVVLGIFPVAYFTYSAYFVGPILIDNADVEGGGFHADAADPAIALLVGVVMGGVSTAIPAVIAATIHAVIRSRGAD